LRQYERRLAAAIPIPSQVTGICSEGYTAANTMLDLFVGGCSVIFLGQIMPPLQPDTDDPSFANVGAGPPYRLQTTSGCQDRNNASVNLQNCLRDAAYSTYIRFGTGRVIPRP
jgi:hypothetical protein